MKNYNTIVYGASEKPYRYSYRAVKMLHERGYTVHPIGSREGEIDGIKILTGEPELENIHTISMYLSAENQKNHYDYIIGLKPQRIIFNPGAENYELVKLAKENGIFTENACTLVLLSIDEYELLENEV